MTMLPAEIIGIYPEDLDKININITEKNVGNITTVENSQQQIQWQCNECDYLGDLKSSVVRHFRVKHARKEVKDCVSRFSTLTWLSFCILLQYNTELYKIVTKNLKCFKM